MSSAVHDNDTSKNPPAPPGPIRRVVTGHSQDGKSVFLEDKILASYKISENSDGLFTGLYRHDEFPASNKDATPAPGEEVKFVDVIASKPKELGGRSGTTFWAVDTPPHSKSSFHRTVTLDYGVVTKGVITLVLDDGKRVKFGPGDVVIQRGTIHEWENETDEWTRVFFVMIPSEKVKVGEKELDLEFR